MNVSKLIIQMKSSRLYAECPRCLRESPLSKAILFDGLGDFPEPAEQRRREMLEESKARLEALRKRRASAGPGAEKKAIEVGIGKIIERIVPTYRGFDMPTCNCRPLFDPIDMIVFNGLSIANLESITFMEIKTGQSKLNKHQLLVREAVVEHKVRFQVV